MNLRTTGACAAALLATCALLAPGCGSGTTIIEVVGPSGDAGAKASGSDDASPLPDEDATAHVDATVGSNDGATGSNDDATVGPMGDATGGGSDGGPMDAGATDTGTSTMDGPVTVPVDASCWGTATSVSGKVYDPAGTNPIPHAFVFVPTDPNGTIPTITPGATTCDTCGVPIGSYVAATMSDATGSFSLSGVPAGTHVPIVVQLGKWRRETFVTVTACQNTTLTPDSTRLPATQAEGDMPAMALVTGGADNLGCLVRRFGIGTQEFKSPHAGGRLDVYKGLPSSSILGFTAGAPGLSSGTAGDCTTDNANCVWNSKSNLESYDLVLLSCQGSTYDATVDAGTSTSNITTSSKQALHDWLGEGGKVFATHFHYTWFANGPSDFRGLATWLGGSTAAAQGTYTVETSFPKAQDFANGLADAGLIMNGGLPMTNVGTSVSTVNSPALSWIQDPSNQDTKYFSFTTPVGSACGKVAFSDLHAGGSPSGDLPASCTTGALTAQERAMELLFFDLSACVSDDTKAPPSPPASN
jgi:hypothetical protein